MRHFKRIIAGVAFCAVVFTVWLMVREVKTDDNAQMMAKRHSLLKLLANSAEIQKAWREGEDSRLWLKHRDQCLQDWNIKKSFDESLLRCSPMLIECIAKYNDRELMLKKDVRSGKWYRYLTKSNVSHAGLKSSGISLQLQHPETKEELSIFLEDNCQEVYLEQRAYAYGEPPVSPDQEDYRFDNFNQLLYLDRHLVTNAEVNDWIHFGNSDFTKNLSTKSGEDLFNPAISLTINQMRDYCSFRGKQLMMAHYFDAATFLPMDLSEKIPEVNRRSPYYWTKKKSEYKNDCSKIFARECLSERPFSLNRSEPTWAGMMDSMGGVFEAFHNPIDPESNLKASSFYFPFNSPWHKLGFRAGWDGEGHALRNFDFRGLNPEEKMDKFQVGFRCMRGVLP